MKTEDLALRQNSIINLIHNIYRKGHMEKKYSVFHTDNAARQNKNQINTGINLRFMIPGQI